MMIWKVVTFSGKVAEFQADSVYSAAYKATDTPNNGGICSWYSEIKSIEYVRTVR